MLVTGLQFPSGVSGAREMALEIPPPEKQETPDLPNSRRRDDPVTGHAKSSTHDALKARARAAKHVATAWWRHHEGGQMDCPNHVSSIRLKGHSRGSLSHR